jgi:hypothetical protein
MIVEIDEMVALGARQRPVVNLDGMGAGKSP